MQNWDSLQPAANYELNWYNNTFGTTKNDSSSHPTSTTTTPLVTTTIEQCFNSLKQQTSIGMDTTSSPISSPRNSDCQDMNYLDNSNETTTTTTSNANHHHHHNHQQHHHHPLGFNPLTPPGLPNAVLPSMNFQSSDLNLHDLQKHENQMKIDENSLTPRNTPPVDVTPPKSPKNFNSNGENTTLLDNDMISNSSEDTRFLESEDDELIRVPIYNSHGKMKNYKCKHCGFLAITKVAFWNHAREHMKPEKMLQCPKCPFVTELKHHLEYHIRKHKNLKPFQCDKCNYSCVNKSMLNSHLKSHSSVYQYRCSDCDYATKYCHSFKLHLRKYEHKPGMVLDEDGTPNPSVVIDVYGTRRGPKMKSGKSRSKTAASKRSTESAANKSLSPQSDKSKDPKNSDSGQLTPKLPANGKNIRNSVSNILPNNLANMLHQTRNMSFLPYFNLNLQMIAAQQHAAAWTQISPQIQQNIFRSPDEDCSEMNKTKDLKELSDEEDSMEQKCDIGNDAMDLSQTTLVKANVLIHSDKQTRQESVKEEQNTSTITSSSNSSSINSKRKCRKIDHHQMENSVIEKQKQQQNQQQDTIKNNCIDNMKTKSSYPIYESKTELPSSSQDDIKVTNSNENPDKNSSPSLSTVSTASASSSSSSTSSTAADCSTSPAQNPVQNFHIPGVFECKYCDIYFKDAVLYTIHMGYHSCDDVFKCNMCGEKCDGPVGLFIHMARNPHS